jgi:hypothetical protein
MTTQQRFLKDPQAVLDYEVDWSAWLPSGDTITAATWTATDGITMDSSAFTDTKATVWLSGGTENVTYNLTCHIVTAAGREDDRTIRILVTSR